MDKFNMTKHQILYEESWQNIQMLMNSIPKYKKPEPVDEMKEKRKQASVKFSEIAHLETKDKK